MMRVRRECILSTCQNRKCNFVDTTPYPDSVVAGFLLVCAVFVLTIITLAAIKILLRKNERPKGEYPVAPPHEPSNAV